MEEKSLRKIGEMRNKPINARQDEDTEERKGKKREEKKREKVRPER